MVLCLSLALGGGSASARLTRVDGISDQNLAHWDNAAPDVSSFSGGYLPNLVRALSAGEGPASPIKLARIVVPWDAMAGADEGGERLHYRLFVAWLKDVRWLGLTPDVAIEQAETAVVSGGKLLARVPGSPEEYERLVSQLLAYAASVGEPIRDLETWNEPNNTGNGPVDVGHPSAAAAAHFMNVASSLCVAHGCTPIAGDFLDSQYARQGHEEVHEANTDTGMGINYENEYKMQLSPDNPMNWGFHPYAAVKYRTTETVTAFEQDLPGGPASSSVWFTEVGAYFCQYPSRQFSEQEQKAGAEYLNLLIGRYFEVAHVFYYEFSNGYRTETNCATGSDTSLYNENDKPRLAADVIFAGAMPSLAVAPGSGSTSFAGCPFGAGGWESLYESVFSCDPRPS